MLMYIFGLVLIVGAIYVVWQSWTVTGFDWWKGIGALAALIAGILVMGADWLKTFSQ